MPSDQLTLRDMKLYDDISSVVSGLFPTELIKVIYDHMRSNKEDAYDHEYLRNSLFVARRLIDGTDGLETNDIQLVYAIVMFIESGRPFTKEYPYDISPGISWLLLRYHAPELFRKEELRFISQSCKPLKPQSLRLSHSVRLQLLTYNTKQLTDIVNFNYTKLLNQFKEGRLTLERTELIKSFMGYYGSNGSLWPAISESAKGMFIPEIAKFKKEVQSAIEIIL